MPNTISTDIAQKPLTPAMEDYLEAIYNLGNEKRAVRVRDIAKRLDVKMPTVTNMLKTLSKRGLIEYEKYEYLELTGEGLRVGEEINRRHCVLSNFLTDILKIDPKKSDEEACKMEHGISHSTMERLIQFLEFVQGCPRAGETWLENFEEYRLHGQKGDQCLSRMKEFSNGFKEMVENAEKMKKEEGKSHAAQQG